MTLSRRHLFGLLTGAAVAPLLPQAAPAQVLTRYTHTSYGLGFTLSREDLRSDGLESAINRIRAMNPDARVRLRPTHMVLTA